MNLATITKDDASSTAIIVKDAILARSGIYVYSHQEMLNRGKSPAMKKDYYTEYRPASVLIAAKDKFKYAVLTKEHPSSITADNVQQVIEGVVGGNIDVVTLDSGEIALKGEIAFYTNEGVDYYNAGAKETSAQYMSHVTPAIEKDYDYVLDEIQSVQGLALTRQGRGGSAVAVLDSIISAGKNSEEKSQGDKVMGKANSILSFFLSDKKGPQDALATVVMDSLTGYEGLSEADKKARRDKVDLIINPLTESSEKKILASTVTDCFSFPKEVLEKKEEIGKGLTSLYKRCAGEDIEKLQATFDSIKAEEKETADGADKEASGTVGMGEKETADAAAKEAKDAKDKKDKEDKEKLDAEGKASEGNSGAGSAAESKDSKALTIDDLNAAIAKLSDNMSATIDSAVKKNLGLEEAPAGPTADSILPSFSDDAGSSSFLTDDLFK